MFAPFKIEHVEQVYKLERESFSSPWTKQQFLFYCINNPESKSFIYLKEKNIIGYIMTHMVLEDIHIHNIAVKQEYRGKGIGGKIISHLIEASIVNNTGKLCLEVKNSNSSAIKLYKKQKRALFQ